MTTNSPRVREALGVEDDEFTASLDDDLILADEDNALQAAWEKRQFALHDPIDALASSAVEDVQRSRKLNPIDWDDNFDLGPETSQKELDEQLAYLQQEFAEAVTQQRSFAAPLPSVEADERYFLCSLLDEINQSDEALSEPEASEQGVTEQCRVLIHSLRKDKADAIGSALAATLIAIPLPLALLYKDKFPGNPVFFEGLLKLYTLAVVAVITKCSSEVFKLMKRKKREKVDQLRTLVATEPPCREFVRDELTLKERGLIEQLTVENMLQTVEDDQVDYGFPKT